MLKKNSYLLMLSIFLFSMLIVNVSAASIIIDKTAPAQIKLGDNLEVMITITNTGDSLVNANIKENIGDAQAIDPKPISSSSNPNIIAAVPPHFEWNVQIDSNSNKVITYTIKPNSVGYYLFSPTILTTSDNQIFYSNTLSTEILCNSNKICESNLGEDFTNCPSDCQVPEQNGTGTSIYFIIGLIILILIGFLIYKRKSILKKIKKVSRKEEKRIAELEKNIEKHKKNIAELKKKSKQHKKKTKKD